MIAPPKPPSSDELEALIKEARARQLRRRFVGAAAVAIAAAIGLSIYALWVSTKPHADQGGGGGSLGLASLPRCRSGQLRAAQPRANGAYTGHWIEDFAIRNVSGSSCSLRGWPTLGFVLQGGHRLGVGVEDVRNSTESRSLPVRPVAVQPRGAVSFNVVGSDFDANRNMGPWPCVGSPFSYLITPPGARVPLRIHEADPYCGPLGKGGYFITPLVRGPLDRYLAG